MVVVVVVCHLVVVNYENLVFFHWAVCKLNWNLVVMVGHMVVVVVVVGHMVVVVMVWNYQIWNFWVDPNLEN